MAMTTDRGTKRDASDTLDQRVVLDGVDWAGYRTLLRLRGDRPVPRMIYLDGTVFFMSPSLPHEHLKERVGRFVDAVVLGLAIPCKPIGQTTLRRRARRGGVEGDQAYYLAHEARVRGKKRIDLRSDPPPDLAIEIVHAHDADAALEVYRRLRVPEVWISTETGFTVLVRQAGGHYAPSGASLAFPLLTADETGGWLRRPETDSETAWLSDLHAWVRDVLAPRARREGGA